MAASASISSCFSTTITTHLSNLSSHSDLNVFRVPVPRVTPRVPSIASFLEHSSVPASVTTAKSRFTRNVAAAASREEAVTASQQEEVASEQTATKLYFGNLPYNCDSARLARILQDYASPEMIEVLYDRITGRSKGFAFVTMSTVEDCKLVIKNLDGIQLAGRPLRVNFADKPRPKVPLYPETEHKLFIGNLSQAVTAEELTEIFQDCGEVACARIVYNGETGRSRGYGFVCYKTKEQMKEAIENLGGVDLRGKPMTVSVAMEKKSYEWK